MFEGVLTALITPFRGGAVDERALAALAEEQIAAGVQGLVPCGSTGESATLSHAEHRRVMDVVVEAAGGRVAVVAGTGSNNTQEALELTRHAKEAGADGALLISPYYNRPTQEGLVAHYSEIATATDFPLVVYNVPHRTGSNMLPTTVARLAEVERIVGIKEACGDATQIAEVIAHCPDDFCVLSGDDAMTLPILALGGRGVISTSSNVVPGIMVELVSAFRAGQVDRARALHYQLLPLFEVLFCESNPIPVKAALALLGKAGDEIRLPLTPLTEPNRERLQVALKELEIL
ncbi:MAG: 4-hydroxy-tetrahydrodipicolinate synthase [Proteobacteria bacterium]|nr:4-hydroxy-tetrahydrodipicolinate synthase [Pseudomonadota bacterium]